MSGKREDRRYHSFMLYEPGMAASITAAAKAMIGGKPAIAAGHPTLDEMKMHESKLFYDTYDLYGHGRKPYYRDDPFWVGEFPHPTGLRGISITAGFRTTKLLNVEPEPSEVMKYHLKNKDRFSIDTLDVIKWFDDQYEEYLRHFASNKSVYRKPKTFKFRERD